MFNQAVISTAIWRLRKNQPLTGFAVLFLVGMLIMAGIQAMYALSSVSAAPNPPHVLHGVVKDLSGNPLGAGASIQARINEVNFAQVITLSLIHI